VTVRHAYFFHTTTPGPLDNKGVWVSRCKPRFHPITGLLTDLRPFAAAQFRPGDDNSRGTDRCAALVTRRAPILFDPSFSRAVPRGTSSVHLEDQARLERARSQFAVQANERGLKDVRRETLDTGVHGLALAAWRLGATRWRGRESRMRPNSVRE